MKFMGVFFIVVFVTTLVAVALASGLNRASCIASSDKMGIKAEYSVLTGCMISVSGQWLPWSEVVPVERGGKIVFEPKSNVRLGAGDN